MGHSINDSTIPSPERNLEEWDYVCKLVYSDSVVEQTKGYEHLLVWKARVGMLPASVTCTLELLQVHLQDQVLWPRIASGKVPPHAAQQLRLTYSTVIMRFLNHLASLFQNTKNQTLYSVAKKLHIPAWMVNIRHDAAHDGNVPSVDVLRLAAGYALSWLHEYWWKPESLSLLDWKPTDNSIYEDTSQVELCNILDLWQALALYQETDYSYVHQIPDKEVSHTTPYTTVQASGSTRSTSYICCTYSSEHLFCTEASPRSLKMWEPVLASLPVAVLLHIIQKLLKLTCSVNGVISNQSRLAALWICELAKAIFKLQKVLNLVDEMNIAASGVSEPAKTLKLAKGISVSFMQDDNLAKLTSKSLRKMLFGRVETDCPDLKDDLVLDVKALPNKKETYEVVKFAVLNPKWKDINVQCCDVGSIIFPCPTQLLKRNDGIYKDLDSVNHVVISLKNNKECFLTQTHNGRFHLKLVGMEASTSAFFLLVVKIPFQQHGVSSVPVSPSGSSHCNLLPNTPGPVILQCGQGLEVNIFRRGHRHGFLIPLPVSWVMKDVPQD
ncbi:hypothetical protein PR048_007348 [Dryococelus australis]|uniref:LAS1-like protein n=1 Tax=Dryococelus australis TaxID=614101 RepID=A0ABQ9IFJ3_9NEOP|nr:hypothetical protein PR048_007348 [Dryococelus australis]